jgi:hypothetical protein
MVNYRAVWVIEIITQSLALVEDLFSHFRLSNDQMMLSL